MLSYWDVFCGFEGKLFIDEISYLLKYDKLKLFKAHPARDNNYQRHCTQLHLLCNQVVNSIQAAKMVMLGISVGSGREGSYIHFLWVENDACFLSISFLVLQADQQLMGVVLGLYILNLTKGPHFLTLILSTLKSMISAPLHIAMVLEI